MFDKDMKIYGKHAMYWKELSQIPPNASDDDKSKYGGKFKIFENYIQCYMLAPIIGVLYGKRGSSDASDDIKEDAGMLAEVQIKNSLQLKYIYRLIILMDDSEKLSDDEKINWAFRDQNNYELEKKGMELYTSYFLGGLEILYDIFINNCTDDDARIQKLYDFVCEFRKEQNTDNMTLDIEELLRI